MLTFTDQHFTDEGDLMYSATSESANVQLSSVEGGIMIVGVTHTAKADDGANGEDQEITVTVTAKDMGDLTVERTFQVNVDGAPTDGEFSATDETISAEKAIPTNVLLL